MEVARLIGLGPLSALGGQCPASDECLLIHPESRRSDPSGELLKIALGRPLLGSFGRPTSIGKRIWAQLELDNERT